MIAKFRPLYHRAWRAAAKAMPPTVRADWLPGYPWLLVFMRAWAASQPQERPAMITSYLLFPDSPWRRAIARAGGPRAAMHLAGIDPESVVWDNWATDENPSPTLDDVASALIQIAGAVGVVL